jgi:CIC family chloride channel protein
MAAVVAGTTHAPMTAIFIVFEMTGDYRIILPVMVACVFGTLVANKLLNESIYTLKLARRGVKLKQGRDANLLKREKVGSVMRREFVSISPNTPLARIMQLMEETNQSDFPIVDHERRYLGMVTFNDLKLTLSRDYLTTLVVAQDLAHTEHPHLHEDASIEEAFQKLGVRDLGSLAVLGPTGSDRVTGILLKTDLVGFYNRKLIQKLDSG